MATFIDLNKQKKNKIVFKKPGEYVAFMYNLSQAITFDIQSEGVDLSVYGVFVGRAGDVFNLESTQHHQKPNSISNLLIKGVFFDDAKFIYKGLIRIEKKATGTKAYQKNQNLKMSAAAFIESDPHLEILTNDVLCGHGSSTGKLSKDELYYLLSRGIDQAQAEKLLLQGFVSEVVQEVQNKVPDFQFNIDNER